MLRRFSSSCLLGSAAFVAALEAALLEIEEQLSQLGWSVHI